MGKAFHAPLAEIQKLGGTKGCGGTKNLHIGEYAGEFREDGSTGIPAAEMECDGPLKTLASARILGAPL